MKHVYLLGLGILCSSVFVVAQSMTPEVYSSSGGHYQNGTGQMSFTIGEPLTHTYSHSSYMITQGFHQPEKNTSSIEDETPFSFNVFPNPSTDFITITTETEIVEYQLALIDELGKIILTRIMQGNNQQLDVSTLAAGTYHLRLTFNKTQINSFTIIKSSKY